MSLDTNPIPIKSALASRGWMTDEFRLPMCRLSDAGRAALKTMLDEYDGVKPAQPARRKAS
jgi:4-hydroxy-tetrahydrodipicolinate synthase